MDGSIASRFLESVNRYPDSIAITDGERTSTYEDVGKLALAVARYLHRLGMKQGDRVGILLPNSPEYVAVFYGIHLAGGVVVPLNSQEPPVVVERLVTHSGAQIVFLNEAYRHFDSLASNDGNGRVTYINVDRRSSRADGTGEDHWGSIMALKAGEVRPDVNLPREQELAAIIYTSGTTGNPKGVMLSHGNIVSNTQAILDYLPIRAGTVGLNILPFYYSFGNSVLHTHLASGASLYLMNTMAFPQMVVDTLEKERINCFYGVPSTYTLLLEHTDLQKRSLDALAFVAQAGGAMQARRINDLRSALPGVKIFVMYGQTEATARISFLTPERLVDKTESVGKPLGGVELKIEKTDQGRQLGENVGEICIRGPNVMLGYWQDADATEKVIDADWLHTGDLGFLDDEGFLYIKGRSMEMIKTGANRVSPQEIEDVVSTIPEISESAAFGVDDDLLGQVIAVAVVCKEGKEIDQKYVQRFCLSRLAPYKIPKIVKMVKALPKTASGKVQRHKLQKLGTPEDGL